MNISAVSVLAPQHDFDTAQSDQLIREVFESAGATPESISQITGLSRGAIFRSLERSKLIYPAPAPSKPIDDRKFTDSPGEPSKELKTLLNKIKTRSRRCDWERNSETVIAFLSGMTLQEIGDRHGITRERVRQILTKADLNGNDGGAHKKSQIRQRKLKLERDERCLQRYGMTYDEYKLLLKGPDGTYQTSAVVAYRQQEANAIRRGIPWLFSLGTWWDVWKASGKWDQRGIGKDEYCMARFFDNTPYHPSTVKIVTNSQNHSEYINEFWRKKKKMGPAKNDPNYTDPYQE